MRAAVFSDPVTGELCHADLLDADGTLVVRLDVPEDAVDQILVMPTGA